MASNFTIDNRTSEKLGAFLNDKIEKDSALSLLLRAFTLIGFEALEKSLNNANTRLILSTGDLPLSKSIASAPGEEKLLNRLNQKALAQRFLKWLKNRVSVFCD
jgi:hypothetical protein